MLQMALNWICNRLNGPLVDRIRVQVHLFKGLCSSRVTEQYQSSVTREPGFLDTSLLQQVR